MRRWLKDLREDPAGPTIAIIVPLVLLLYAWQTHMYAQVCTSDLTLWAHASETAPWKPRPALNYGVALVVVGRFAEARVMFQRALVLADGPDVPAWDREATKQTARDNLAALGRLEARTR